MIKKINKILLVSLMSLMLIPININAASASASVTGVIMTDSSGTLKISANAPGGFFQGTITNNNPGVASAEKTGKILIDTGEDTTKNPSFSTNVTPNSTGKASFSINIKGEDYQGNPFELVTTVYTEVKKKSTDTGGDNGNNGGSNNNGGGTKPGTSNPGTTKPDKELTEEEKKAKEEAEKKAQLEAEQKIPLVEGIKISSRSPKMEGVALETLGTEEGTFSYSYELPKNIDRVGLELIPSKEGVELTYEKEIDFGADETSKTITANAKSGEISQDYEIVLTRTIPVVNKTEIDGKKLTVLDDETLDSNMKTLGFERQEYEIEGGMGYFFVNGDIKLQLLVDENNNGSWHLLDEANKPSEEVILLESGTNYALVLNAPEAMQKETLNTEKYSEKTVDFESRYTEVSTTLVMNNKYKAWTAEDGEVFYGIMNGGEKRLHYKTKNDDGLVFEKAFVGFDHTNGTSKTVAIVSTATLGIAVIAGVVYTIMLKKKK